MKHEAIFVLGGGIIKKGNTFYPTDYSHEDPFGMLGAGMRVAAASELYFEGDSNTFIFCTGITAKTKAQLGNDVPSEAQVMKDKFLRNIEGLLKKKEYRDRITGLTEATPEIILEDKSTSSLTNIQEVLGIISGRGWKKVAIVSSDYHIPRVKALYEMVLITQNITDVHIDFISAEEKMKEVNREVYDGIIEKAYRSESAKKRIDNETKGLRDIKDGTYSLTEFQLKKK